MQHSALANGFASAAQCIADRTSRTRIPRLRNDLLAAASHIKMHAPSRFNKVHSTAQHQWRQAQTADAQELPEDMRNPIELKHDAQNIIYTDGSRREIGNAGIITGAGVHRSLATAPTGLS